MQIGFVGLGKMGSGMASKLLEDGHEVVVWNRTLDKISNLKSKISNLQDQNLVAAESVEDLVVKLQKPRVIWLMLPAGKATEEVLTQIAKHVDTGDIVIDGGNAYYKDTQRRYETFAMNNVSYLGVGVSGGVKAEENGYPLMIGGTESAYESLLPVFETLSKPYASFSYLGEGGAGHFVKMVHNGIEYGMMQAIGEGFGVLDRGGYELDLAKVAKSWQKGTIVSGFLMDCASEALRKNPELEGMEGEVGHSGEGEWTVEAGKEEDVPVPVIEKSLEFRKHSHVEKEIKESFAAKMLNALRLEFGGHEVKKKED